MIIAPTPRRRFAWVAVVAAVVSLVLFAAPAAADPLDDQAALEQQMEQVRFAMEGATQRATDAAVALTQANALIPQAQQLLADAQAALAVAQERAAPAQAKVDEIQVQINAIAVRAYMGGDLASLDAMLAASSPADLINGLTYLEYVSVGQRQAIETRRAAGADVLEAYTAAKAAEEQAAAAQEQLTALVQQREQALTIAQEEESATRAQWNELEAKSQEIAAQVRSIASGGGPLLNPGAPFIMPLFGSYKSSDFGYRLDPVYGVYQLHAGVDLAAPAGTDIYAGAAGDVFQAGWNGGYGNYTCVYHGNFPAGSGSYSDPTLGTTITLDGKGLSTCYAHQSAILVSAGQHVEQGQIIGRVGTTGASTGNHLHFEVRIDGSPYQPLRWLPSCMC